MDKEAGIIYYTDNHLSEPLFLMCQRFIAEAKLSIVSCSLKPLGFGQNVVVKGKPGYPTMIKQIVTALEHSRSEYVFFCEHDVLYSGSHFKFLPPRDDIFYYNSNCWRWQLKSAYVVRWDRMISLSGMCCNRQLALEHYKMRLQRIEEQDPEKFSSREPQQARIWGYEPGTKKKRRGGLTDDEFDTWESEYPNIDIRHKGTFSPPKITLGSFKHQPTGWIERSVDQIEGWKLKELFK